MSQVSILIIDDDETSQNILGRMLDSDGWKLRIAPLAHRALAELANGNWTLVIVNVAISGLDGPLFTTLKELAQAAPVEAGRTRARVLFLVPQLAGPEVQPLLEQQSLPYTFKPFHLHDFLEKVSDLLLETNAIPGPIRRLRPGPKPSERGDILGASSRSQRRSARQTTMFSSRSDYVMTEEEIEEFEKQEAEERKKKQKKDTPDIPV